MRKNIRITATDFAESELEIMRTALAALYTDVGLSLGGMRPAQAGLHMRQALPLIAEGGE